MKALWFVPFAFAGGAEGFALFAPYLIGVLTLLYVVRTVRVSAAARRALPPRISSVDVLPAAAVVAHPAL
jgi:hypothetical protein